MDVQARAGIDLYGTVLRYAEVEQYGARYRLLRLGSCDFDFDVTRALLREETPEHLEIVTEALGDVFSGSVASQLHVALHPPDCYAFFSSLPTGLAEPERWERLHQEAALLTAATEVVPLRLTAEAVYTEAMDDGSSADRFHVLALKEQTWVRLEEILRASLRSRCRLGLSMQGAARAIEKIEQREEEAARPPFTLAVGWYPTHVEYVLCREGRWYFSHYATAGASVDCAYFAVALLSRLKLPASAVGRILLYGVGVDLDGFGSLQAVFRVPPEQLNPIRLVDLDLDSLADSFDAEAYAPCIGLAL